MYSCPWCSEDLEEADLVNMGLATQDPCLPTHCTLCGSDSMRPSHVIGPLADLLHIALRQQGRLYASPLEEVLILCRACTADINDILILTPTIPTGSHR